MFLRFFRIDPHPRPLAGGFECGLRLRRRLCGSARRRRQAELALARGHREIDIGEQLRIEQRTVQLPLRIVDAEAPAQRVQRNPLPRIACTRHLQRVLDRAARFHVPELRSEPRELGIEEADVERGVVDHQFRAVDEGEEFVDDLVEARLVGEEFQREPGDFLRAGGKFAVGVEVGVERAPAGPAFQQFDAADFDDAVAAVGVQAGGFGIEHDLSHGSSGRMRFSLPASRVRARFPPPRVPARRRVRCRDRHCGPSPNARRCGGARSPRAGVPTGRGS